MSSQNIAYYNGQAHPFEAGETILQFSERLQLAHIPTLCDEPRLKPHGACRVCSVEVAQEADGPRRTVASCHTPMSAGMHIFSHSDAVVDLRRNIVELVLSDHPPDCLTCEVNGNCELQDVAAEVGVREIRYHNAANHLDRDKDLSHPYLKMDLTKCINCARCVRACDEIQGQFVLGMAGRGFDAHIIKDEEVTFGDSSCVSCGACAQSCPTAAISDQFQSKAVVAEKRVRTTCPYCGVGCNLEVAVRGDQVLSIQGAMDAEVNAGHTCLKGRYAFKFYNHPERIRTPLIKRNGEFVEASWDEAYELIVRKLSEIKANHGPDAIAGISSSRCTNEENYLMQKFIRGVIGTNNIDGCARVCHAPTAWGMQQSFGTGAATNSISDLEHTDLVMVIGANPTDAHPVTGAKIKQKAMAGLPLIVIDPIRTELARHATYHLQLRPGTNVAMLNLFARYLVEEGLVDRSFIESRCEDYAIYETELLSLDITELEEITGVDRELARQAAIAYGSAANAMCFHGLGVTEHSQGSRAVMLISNLAMMTGNIGRPGVGVNPLRGQNNVQGAADMGVQPHQGAGYLDVTDPKVAEHYQKLWGVAVPTEIGDRIPEMFDAALAGKLKAMWIMGEDPAQTDPNTEHVVKALKSLDFLVVQELFLAETALLADVVLPGASFLEKSGTFTNGERRVQRVNAAIDPLPGTKADGQIMVDIMNRMGYPQAGYDPAIHLEEIAQVVPFFRGISWERLGTQGLQWPVAEDGTDTQILHTEEFKRGKGRFHHIMFEESAEILEHGKAYPLILTTTRRLEHYNCGTMTRRTDNSRILDSDLLLINPMDAELKEIHSGDRVRLYSGRGEVFMTAQVSDRIKPGILHTTFHFPEVMVNRITSDVSDHETLCPEYKVVAVDVERASL